MYYHPTNYFVNTTCYILFFDGEPATLKATQGVKTLGSVDLGDASLQTSLAVTTLPSAASLSPASPIHCNIHAMIDERTYKILSRLFLRFISIILIARARALARRKAARDNRRRDGDGDQARAPKRCGTFLPRFAAFSY
jgi:hypothetical protein